MNTRLNAALAALLLLVSTLLPGSAWALNVGYYSMDAGAGESFQTAPITAAGHTPVNITVPNAAQLAGVDVLFVTNNSNGNFGAEYVANLSAIAAAVNSGGLVLVIHDRRVTNANTILPGGAGITVVRYPNPPNPGEDSNVDIRNAGTLVTNGPAGILSNSSLDGGNSSSHGYALESTLPTPGGVSILSNGTPTRSVFFAYKHGAGSVLYSTIPLDFYLRSGSPQAPAPALRNVYAPNIIHYAVSLVPSDDPPTLIGLINQTVEAASAAGTIVNFTVTASDPQDVTIATNCTPISGSTFVIGTTTVNCSATDSGGNTTDGSFTVTVQDTTKPVLTVPGDIIEEATSSAGAVVTFLTSATDAVDASVDIVCTPASGSTFALGDTTVSCTATDDYTNSDTESFKVTVQDKTPPTLTLPADITQEATGPNGAAVSFVTSATDLVDGAVTPSCDYVSGAIFPLGPTTVSCSATDQAGNTSEGAFTVTVVDTTPPALTVPADINGVEATGPAGAAVMFSATATDLVDGSVPPLCVPPSGSTFPLGTTTVTCTATDRAGNSSPAQTFKIMVVDTTPPVVTVPDDITKEATGPSGAVATFSATAVYIVDGSVTPVCVPASGFTFPLGTNTVSCTATDAANNPSAPKTFTVKVQDTTAPSISCPAEVTGRPNQSVVLGSPTVSDLVDLTPTVTNDAPASFGPGTTTVKWTATDDYTNSASCNQKVTLTYEFLGFFQPVDNLPVVNTVKNGSTVPVKWQLKDANGLVTAITTVREIKYVGVPCLGGAEDVVETTTTGGTLLRWDSTAMQFVYNWKTPAKANYCARLMVYFNDDTVKAADFKLK